MGLLECMAELPLSPQIQTGIFLLIYMAWSLFLSLITLESDFGPWSSDCMMMYVINIYFIANEVRNNNNNNFKILV